MALKLQEELLMTPDPHPPRCYKTNFLSKVILRVDFSNSPMGPLLDSSEFSRLISTTFPHVTSTPLVEIMVNMTTEGNAVEQKNVGTQWLHSKGVASTATATLAPSYFSLEYGPGDYTSFFQFVAEFESCVKALTTAFSLKQVDRIGLRYVNEIRIPGRALEWDGIINPNLLAGVLANLIPGGRLLRSMHQRAERHGEDQVLLNYGILNPDYPAPVVQRFFILDLDCSRQGITPITEALVCVQRLNDLATEVFESSIEDGLRTILGTLS